MCVFHRHRNCAPSGGGFCFFGTPSFQNQAIILIIPGGGGGAGITLTGALRPIGYTSLV